MQSKIPYVVAAIGAVAVFTLVVRHGWNSPNIITNVLQKATEDRNQDSSLAKKFLEQRNDVSKKLNDVKRHLGQLSCELMKLKQKAGEKVDSRVSENGGWCAETSGRKSDQHVTDVGLSKVLSKFFKGKHVASFGDGPGEYKRLLDSYKEVASYAAFDGAPFCEQTTEGRVNFMDLTAPQYGLEARDWVISLEVAEHIPKKFEDVYLDNIARHAKEGIILSWAPPGQGGLSHVNNQPLSHVIEELKKRGFEMDTEPGKKMRAAAKFGWLRDNIYVYRRMDPKSFRLEDA